MYEANAEEAKYLSINIQVFKLDRKNTVKESKRDEFFLNIII